MAAVGPLRKAAEGGKGPMDEGSLPEALLVLFFFFFFSARPPRAGLLGKRLGPELKEEATNAKTDWLACSMPFAQAKREAEEEE